MPDSDVSVILERQGSRYLVRFAGGRRRAARMTMDREELMGSRAAAAVEAVAKRALARAEAPRIVLRLPDPDVAALDWEAAFPVAVPVVRTSPVPPRALVVPFAPPVRVLDLTGDASEWMKSLPAVERLAPVPGARADLVVMAWPATPARSPLTTTEPETPGSLGWVERLTIRWDARVLVVLAPASAAAEARRVAHALVERGGPAIVVAASAPARAALAAGLDPSERVPGTAVFTGAGREDALRPAPRRAERPSLVDALLAVGDAVLHYRGPEAGTILSPRLKVRLPRREFLTRRGFDVVVQDEDGLATRPLPVDRPARVVVGAGELAHLLARADPHSVVAALDLPDDDAGRWLEVAVVGLDCDVLGDSVQALWLPGQGVGPRAVFAVVPRRAGRMHVRVCVYADLNLVQSLLVTAATARPRARPMLRVLRSEPDRAATEYARASDAAAMVAARPRTLSIVANDRDGAPVISFKGPDLHTTASDPGVGAAADALRTALDVIATPGRADPSIDPRDLLYGFAADNSGFAGRYDDVLVPLAAAGWALYEASVREDARAAVAAIVSAGGTIQAAHLRLTKVLPWAGIYDRYFDADRRRDEHERPVRHAACPAPIAGGHFDPGVECGRHEACLLHDGNRDHPDGVHLQSTVACPLRFWGFRNIIEVAPFQAEEGRTAHEWPVIDGGERPQVVFGAHGGLPLVGEHVEELRRILADRAELVGPEYDRDRVVDLLRDGQPAVVYLYCHQDGGVGSDVHPPVLRLRRLDEELEGRIQAPQFSGPAWEQHPLVVLNGCRTAAYRPDALSPFIVTLMQDRQAAGLLGTEIPVWEELARHAGRRMLEALLAGRPAGEALLELRQELMARQNPLGLAYTLYAPAELRLARD